jgi:hypothetical protein
MPVHISIGGAATQPFQGERRYFSPSHTQARAAGISAERLYAYRAQGLIDGSARGQYRWADAPEIDQDLLEIAHGAPRGTLCLVTAFARRGLTDVIPPGIYAALSGCRAASCRGSEDRPSNVSDSASA